MVALAIVPKTISIEEILREDDSLDRSDNTVVCRIIILLWPFIILIALHMSPLFFL